MKQTQNRKEMKTTKSTIKSFIRRNNNNLFINVRSSFDGMVDGCVSYHDGFTKAVRTNDNERNTLGVQGAWFVGSSRDYFTAYSENGMTGYRVSNCCGSFILAVKS